MSYKTPSFWYEQHVNLKAATLVPASWLYGLGRRLHVALSKPQAPPCPVICVGNVNAGGSGKTPVCMALMALLKSTKLAKAPAFLMRGYGGSLAGPALVKAGVHGPQHVGEEALMLAEHGDVVVAQNRHGGAVYAQAQGHDVLVMDDGLQNRSLEASVNLIVVHGDMGFGNGQLLPAGPLREPLHAALERADALILIGEDTHNIKAQLPEGLPVFTARIEVTDKPDDKAAYFAFAGIGYPEKFFATLRDDLKLDVRGTAVFGDHHAYSAEDIEKLTRQAHEADATLITTEKDMKQLEQVKGVELPKIVTVPIALQFDEPGAVEAFLREAL